MTTRTQPQSSSLDSRLRLDLRSVMLVDAGVSGLNGLAYLAGAAVLDDLLGLGTPWLLGFGAFLVVWAVALAVIGTRSPISRALVREVALLNLAWVAGSIAVLVLADLTAVGVVWCVLQAVVVTAFAVAQLALARSGR